MATPVQHPKDLSSLDDVLRGIGSDKLNQKCSTRDLDEISKSLTNLSSVSPWLWLTEADEEDAREQSNPGSCDLARVRMNVLRIWKRKQGTEATYRSLVKSFFHANRLDLVDKVLETMQAPTSTTPPISSLCQYGDYLKKRYEYYGNISTTFGQWPPVSVQKACKLAMIRQEKIERGDIQDSYVRKVMSGEVNSILQEKPHFQVELHEILNIDTEDRKVVVIEGPPGSGKSVLSLDICKRWGTGELFQEYNVVVHVQLRNPDVQSASSLADFLPAQDKAMAEEVCMEMIECKGETVLFVLDGWDELPCDCPGYALFCSLIEPHGTWLKSPVIITTRSISAAKLHPLVSSRLKIIGFTPKELKEYFTECMKCDSVESAVLLEKVEENPFVASSCYLPLNAAIIVHLFLSGNRNLPNTVHGLFTSLVLCWLARYLRVRCGLGGEAANIESLDRLPGVLHEPFRQLCSLAFSGAVQDKVTFTTKNLENLGIETDVLALGLLQAVPTLVKHQVSVFYNFLHLQVQELLAAYHISFLPGSEQIDRFQQLFHQTQFGAVFQFYAGITRFQSERKYLSKFAFILPVWLIPTKILDVIAIMVRSGSRHVVLLVIRCLYEADDHSLCNFVAKHLNNKLDLHDVALSPLDCLSIGYFLYTVCIAIQGVFSAVLWGCSIDDNCCKFLVKGISYSSKGTTEFRGQLELDLDYNCICEEGVSFIADCLRDSTIFRGLYLSGNHIGEAGFKLLSRALTTNLSLSELRIWKYSFTITEDNGPALTEMLERNNTLQVLSLSINPGVSDTGVAFIASGLKRNNTLETLDLHSCGITDKGLESLSNALKLNRSLKLLELRHNDCISNTGVTHLMECLKSNNSLIELWLPYRFKSNNIQNVINGIRRNNGHPLINVTCL